MPYEDAQGNVHYTVEEQNASPDAEEEVDAKPLFYVCAHRSSNTPCPIHHRDMYDVDVSDPDNIRMVPKPGAIKDEDWHKSYASAGPEDQFSMAVTDPDGG